MYCILLNRLEGVELVLKALRQTQCIASHTLADGIEANLCEFKDGVLVRVNTEELPARREKSGEYDRNSVTSAFSVLKGGKG